MDVIFVLNYFMISFFMDLVILVDVVEVMMLIFGVVVGIVVCVVDGVMVCGVLIVVVVCF